jgi:hypothetical protein
MYATAEDSGLLECENVLGEWFLKLQKKYTSTFKVQAVKDE